MLNSRHVVAALAIVLVTVIGAPIAGRPELTEPAVASTEQPNIVIFMLDDTAVHDGRLWGNPSLTPNIYDRFVRHGIHLSNAITETPLCCPARATLMTGLHTHNHGVKVNDVTLFDPSVSLASELKDAGYETMLVGKYMNRPEKLTSDLWTRHSSPWSVFDIFFGNFHSTTGFYVDYTIASKDGQPFQPDMHSTQFIGQQAVSRMSSVDADKPLFALLSMVDTHLPNIPMPGFENDPRWSSCDAMEPWKPPNYNEPDVSDKPPYIQSLPLLPAANGWPMTTYCKQMLGVDRVVAMVTDELAKQDRLDNTLMVFMADNGMAWGSHRLQLKETPYVTPIPLYMSWPERWGRSSQEIDEYVSNIDLAPTLCEVAGCVMGPFPGGRSGADGLSLMPLLDGDVASLGRDALLETEYRLRPWVAVRTTHLSPLGLWHYVEHQTGFRELYDLEQDPWELENLAYEPAYEEVRADLSNRLLRLLAEGRRDPTAQVTIVEDSLPNAGQDFAFSGDFGSFLLDDDSNATLPRKRVFWGLSPGQYSFQQASVAGWDTVSISCPTGSQIDLENGLATVNLYPGDRITCTFKNAGRKPDASIALVPEGPFKGDNLYSSAPGSGQTQRRDLVQAGQAYDFVLRLQNDSQLPDSFTVRGSVSGSQAMSVAYLVGGSDVSAQVSAGTYRTIDLVPGASILMTMRVTVAADAAPGITTKAVVRQTSVADPTRVDVARGVVTH
jgi:arylsulfatase A-like enzyme